MDSSYQHSPLTPLKPHFLLPLTINTHFLLLLTINTHSLLLLTINTTETHFLPPLTIPPTRYQQEEAERRERLERQQKEEAERKWKEKLRKEASLRDRLIRNVQQLEHRKRVLQRELVSRGSILPHEDRGSSGSQLSSAVVVPKSPH